MLTKQMQDENFLLCGSDAASLSNRAPTFRTKIQSLSALEEPEREVHWSSPCCVGRGLRKNGVVIPLPHTPLWCAHTNILFCRHTLAFGSAEKR